ncbi:MAG TPA: serine/threonine-protein kinase [Pirellulales bacterium]|nr:serine/threonine-protein kinase [Pirellulales bacterium]
MAGSEPKAPDVAQCVPETIASYVADESTDEIQAGAAPSGSAPRETGSGISHAPEVDAGQRLDDFDLLLPLGQGAFARVFLARQRSMQRLVALKVSADESQEPQTMAQLDHPHIVRVYDQRAMADRRLRLIYMQYVPGGTLQAVVERVRECSLADRRGKLLIKTVDECLLARGESPPIESSLRRKLAAEPWPRVVCWLGARLAGALAYAHQHGVLHRDLKPANVLLSADGTPKLADFNISFCSQVEGAAPAASFGGSLPYMSPEQLEAFGSLGHARPAELDARSDVYSLGILLWELLTGERPFADPAPATSLKTALAGMVEARRARSFVRDLPGGLPAGLKEILLRCLAFDRAERFATAGELERQLELCLQPRARRLLQPPPGDWRLAAQRHCLLVLVLAGLAPNLAASGLSIAYNWFAIIARLAPRGQQLFANQILLINPIAYALAVAWLLNLARPVLRGVAGRLAAAETGGGRSSPEWALARQRSLWLGDYVAWVTAAAWTASGVCFVSWLRLSMAGDEKVVAIDHVHFFTALVLCGLMAATLSFFAVTFVAVRVYFPRLIEQAAGDSSAANELHRLAKRSGFYFVLAVSVPFLSMVATVLLLEAAQDRIAVSVLGTLGLFSFAVAYRLSQEIQRDVAALTIALDPDARDGDERHPQAI